MNIRPGNTILDKLSRWFLKQRTLSRKHPLTRWCLKSTTAVNYEILRHLKSHRYMIHPFSTFRLTLGSFIFYNFFKLKHNFNFHRIVWESLMTVFTVVALLVTPVSITFYFEKHENWHIINDTMNIVFLCDIIVWFFTGYYDYGTKVTVLDPMIVARYLNFSIIIIIISRYRKLLIVIDVFFFFLIGSTYKVIS